MKKKIIINFLKDSTRYTIAFCLSISSILLYYKLTLGVEDMLYPIVIASTIYIILMIIEFIKYYSFNMNIHKSINSDVNKLLAETNQQKYFSDILKEIHKKHLEDISKINAANNSYRYFFSQWIHNMKTPVSVISLVLQKVENDILIEDKKLNKLYASNFVREIQEENSKLQNGLEQLLNILRMEQFVKDYEPEAVNLIDDLKEIINSKKSLFIYNNVFPQLECQEEDITVFTDKKWNKLMLEQIINNAVKYSSEKGKKKYIKFSVNMVNKGVQLSIKDKGIGIPESDINRVFEPFFTGENGRKHRDASGIGLYVSSLIAKNLKHKIEIQSEQKKGTTVLITYFLNR